MHSNNGDKYYISNGGQTYKSIGVAMLMKNKDIKVVFRTPTRQWNVGYDRVVSLHTWYHVVLAWNITSKGKVYINGILVCHDQNGSRSDNNQKPNVYMNFILGTSNRDYAYPGAMTLDELRIWDALVNDTEILGLYASDAFP